MLPGLLEYLKRILTQLGSIPHVRQVAGIQRHLPGPKKHHHIFYLSRKNSCRHSLFMKRSMWSLASNVCTKWDMLFNTLSTIRSLSAQSIVFENKTFLCCLTKCSKRLGVSGQAPRRVLTSATIRLCAHHIHIFLFACADNALWSQPTEEKNKKLKRREACQHYHLHHWII